MNFIIVGLGNPGEEYQDTKHNAGRMVLEALRKKLEFSDWENRKEFTARYTAGNVGDNKITLLEPETFMNLSGKSVVKCAGENVVPENIIVVHDDLDLPIGKFRISFDRGNGGHKGVLSIETLLKTRRFVRVRVGVSPVSFLGMMKKPKGADVVEKFVLSKFGTSDTKKLLSVIEDCISAIEDVLKDGRDTAMGKWNGKSL
jgi:PTH1 family peptidyl-tRNA hydrolase